MEELRRMKEECRGMKAKIGGPWPSGKKAQEE
jgi:hypothetical protein